MDSIENEHDQLPHFAMNGGDGPLSYDKNSSYQRGVLDVAKPIIEEEILKKLEISSMQNGYCIADFGCSTGNNSFPAMHIIIEAIKRRYESSSDNKIPEFHVLFNDVVSNDFNTLFSSLPPNRDYSVAAVPGGFHGRLLPASSVHFAYSSWALHWLSEVPKAALDRNSPAWNGGEICYTRERKEVCDAYLDQFGKDFEAFLNCRAVEMVNGGLMSILIPGVPAFWDPKKEFTLASIMEHLTPTLVDMAKEGKLEEAKIESFNTPCYFPSLQQLRAILERSHSFSIERIETLNIGSFLTVNGWAASMRAVNQSILIDHFGGEIIEEFFDLFEKKLAASPVIGKPENDKSVVFLAILKRIIA